MVWLVKLYMACFSDLLFTLISSLITLWPEHFQFVIECSDLLECASSTPEEALKFGLLSNRVHTQL